MGVENDHRPEKVIEDIGGCGRYQIRMVVVTHCIKTAVCFAMSTMFVSTVVPHWECNDVVSNGVIPSNDSTSMVKSCVNVNKTACEKFVYSGIRTVVSEFNLVCDQAYIPALLMGSTSIGMLIGNPVGGQLADIFGRKLPYFGGVLLIGVGSLISYFSTTWTMFLVCGVFVGIGSGFFMTVQYNLMSEFTLAKWRTWIVGFPSWQIQGCLFALIGWLLNDWQYLQLVCVGVCVLCLTAWWIIPESFRWYIAHDRYTDAKKVLEAVAKFNKRELPETILDVKAREEKPDRKYTFIDLFRTRHLVKMTLLSALNWLALGLITYGLAFNIQTLSGNIYINICLFSVTSAPVKIFVSLLLNKIGRKRASIACFGVAALGGFIATILTHIDTPNRATLIKGCAIIANMGMEGAWGTVQTMTVELFPTVVRNIGFGSLSTVARIAGALGPQLVFLDTYLPGAVYIICGGLSVLCIIGHLFLPETLDAGLQDKIQETKGTGETGETKGTL